MQRHAGERIRHERAFFNDDEMDILGLPERWHPSTVHDDAGLLMHSSHRTSTQSALRSKAARAMLTDRMVAYLRTPLTFDEGSYVKYEPSQRYDVHGDAAGMRSGREWTLLVGVQAAEVGGATRFPHLNRQYVDRGDALIWCNYRDGVEDADVDHEARSVRLGTKIVVNAWFSDATP